MKNRSIMCRLRTRLYHIALGVGMCLSIGACDLLEVDPTSVITSVYNLIYIFLYFFEKINYKYF